MNYTMNRRNVLKLGAATAMAASIGDPLGWSQPETRCKTEVPFRAITKGPKSHWFGYYDKLQFDPSNRYVLGMEIGFDDRAPKPDDTIQLGMVDLGNDNQWTELAETKAWCWQQGCMLQWIPGSDRHVIYNDRQEGRFVSVVLDVKSGEKRVLPMPIYALSPNGKEAVTLNFARLDETRPGYGYSGVADHTRDERHPEYDGIYRLNLESGKVELIVSLDQISRINADPSMKTGKHWFNHLLVNPDGTRFIFLHRWESGADDGPRWHTRMFTAQMNGSNLFCLADHHMVSHFIWRDANHILAWSREPDTGDHFHLYRDVSSDVEVVGEGILTRDGHCTYSPDGEWILVDTYPDGERMQNLRLFRPKDNKIIPLGRFYLSPDFKGQTRCDLHPRWSRDGRTVCIDSLHSGQRQMYVLDVSEII